MRGFIKKTSMKTLTLLSVFIFSLITAICQNTDLEVISTGGDDFKKSNSSISWTIGEIATETFSDTNNILTQGFQQSKLTVISIKENKISELDIKVYPNPTKDLLSIEIDSEEINDFQIMLFDLNGKKISQTKMTEKKKNISMNIYPTSTYILKIIKKEKEISSYKIIKQ